MAWVSVSRLEIKTISGDIECGIYANRKNRVGVIVYIKPVDDNGDPIPRSELSHEKLKKAIKLIDDATGDELSPVSDKGDGWSYHDESNEFGGMIYAARGKSMPEEENSGLRKIKFYVSCSQNALVNPKRVAVQVKPTSGDIISTSGTYGDPTLATFVKFSAHKEITYFLQTSHCDKIEFDWKKADVYYISDESSTGKKCSKMEVIYEYKVIYLHPNSMLVSMQEKFFAKTDVTTRTESEVMELEKLSYKDNAQWIAGYLFSKNWSYTVYVWSTGEEGVVYNDSGGKYRLLGRAIKVNGGKYYLKVPFSEKEGCLSIIVTRENLSHNQNGDNKHVYKTKKGLVVYDQYGNSGKFNIDIKDNGDCVISDSPDEHGT